ncbi:hypothetical protein EWM64_g5651 [Hericium alpestre]|uniref:Uncharacterized protein n=1 Tax=Hericium alpestre TaxID=135208 RepID=A0A4Y9ZWR9_9AGAM|nr:hypothetical protein EWM64_g5651 [Hericium alpestre]
MPSFGKFVSTNEAVSYGRSESDNKIFLKRVHAGVSGVEDAGSLTVPQGADFFNFDMDPQQDVCVLTAIHPTTLHIRSLTTGQGHPLAAVQDIPLNTRPRSAISSTLGADFVLASCYEMSTGEGPDSREKLFYKLYNWKTGALHMVTQLVFSGLSTIFLTQFPDDTLSI